MSKLYREAVTTIIPSVYHSHSSFRVVIASRKSDAANPKESQKQTQQTVTARHEAVSKEKE
ncbi:MAG: hypothetical protein CMC68_03810, partial [Flavobacteriaceae bacterium]|nr:hypothetical protein [Flavobacteriaceae bacterium]